MFTRGLGAGTHEGGRRRRIEEESVTSDDRLRELEDKYEDYKVYDNRGDKIGKVDDLFVDESDREEYIGVKLGLLGRKSTLIPMDIVRVNEADKAIEVSDTKDHVNDAPSFDDDEDITGEYERRIREHFGLEAGDYASQGGYAGTSAPGTSTAGETDDREGDHSSEGSNEGTATAERRSGSTAEDEGSQSVPEYRGPEGSTSSEQSTGATGSSGVGFSGGTTQGVPTSRQTEETETFQEGGRTKIRRRVIREEIVDADEDPNA